MHGGLPTALNDALLAGHGGVRVTGFIDVGGDDCIHPTGYPVTLGITLESLPDDSIDLHALIVPCDYIGKQRGHCA